MLRLVDLFSGAGGMTLGAIEAARSQGLNVEVALAMELSDSTRDVYDANFVSTLQDRRGDVRCRFDGDIGGGLTFNERYTLKELGSIDILLGGPPCQGHSSLNNHTRRRDPKNDLYLKMIRAVEVIEPQSVVIENVPDVRLDSSHVVAQGIHRLSLIGYRTSEFVVATQRLGVPQLRTRHVLVATRASQKLSIDSLNPYVIDAFRDLRWAIGDLVSESAADRLSAASVLSEENNKRARYLLRSGKYDLPNRLRPPCHRDKPSHKYKSMYGRLAWDLPAQTITTGFGSPGQGRYLHPDLPRTITPHEAARLQFFPDWFDFSPVPNRSILAQCIGNAVPSKLAFCLCSVLLPATRPGTVSSSRVEG
jgi:DNA (cytosine-5)-methyltransferase 1